MKPSLGDVPVIMPPPANLPKMAAICPVCNFLVTYASWAEWVEHIQSCREEVGKVGH